MGWHLGVRSNFSAQEPAVIQNAKCDAPWPLDAILICCSVDGGRTDLGWTEATTRYADVESQLQGVSEQQDRRDCDFPSGVASEVEGTVPANLTVLNVRSLANGCGSPQSCSRTDC